MADHSAAAERDYVLGTHDVEAQRLGLQHAAWRPYVTECWDAAGVAEGWHVLDVGAGPGHAAFDLAERVGPTGSVTAVERSARFVEAGRRLAAERDAGNVHFVEVDLMADHLPGGPFDAAWCRWVCSFVQSPALLVQQLGTAVREGGLVMFHEYVNYASWRFSPRLPNVEEYVSRVMASWRDAGGEPDVAMDLPPLLHAHGFEVLHARPRIFCVRPDDPLWFWWISPFVLSNLERMRELGAADAEWLNTVRREFLDAERDAETLLLTPTVLEIVATKRGT